MMAAKFGFNEKIIFLELDWIRVLLVSCYSVYIGR